MVAQNDDDLFCAAVLVAVTKLPAWRDADALYLEADRWLEQQGAIEATVMVANFPAFW